LLVELVAVVAIEVAVVVVHHTGLLVLLAGLLNLMGHPLARLIMELVAVAVVEIMA
jgi:hypothetical protein